MSSEDAKESNEKVESKETESVAADTAKAKKDRKPFQWTEKRKEAFEKMRAGLELKNEIALKLKQEKQKSEKEEIKKRVREIMNGQVKKAKEVEVQESEDSDSSVEAPKKPKKTKKEKSHAKEPVKKEKKSRKAEKVVSESESEAPSASEASSDEQERFVRSKKSIDRAAKNRVNTGKTQRTSTHYLASDRFILL